MKHIKCYTKVIFIWSWLCHQQVPYILVIDKAVSKFILVKLTAGLSFQSSFSEFNF